MPPASQPGAPPLADPPAMSQSRQTTPPTARCPLLRSRIEPLLVEVVFIDFQGRPHQRCRTGQACVRDRFQCARSTRSDGLTFVVEKRVVVHGLFRLFHAPLLWNSGPLPHRPPLPAYILTESYVGIVSARCVKGDSNIHPGHTSLHSPTARPTPMTVWTAPSTPPASVVCSHGLGLVEWPLPDWRLDSLEQSLSVILVSGLHHPDSLYRYPPQRCCRTLSVSVRDCRTL